LWLFVPWVGLVIAAFQPIRDNSFLWHIRAGSVQIDAGEVLRADPFSSTFGGEPWRTQSWLIELLYGRLEEVVGLAFVPFFILGFGLVVIATVSIRLRSVMSDRRGLALALILLVWIAVSFLVPRPVIVSFALLALLIGAVSSRRTHWLIPMLIWIWAASHGSFALGIGYLVLEGLRRNDRKLLLHAGGGVIVACLTAHGWHVWATLADFAANRDALSYITEWAVPSVTDLSTLPFFAGIGGLLWNAVAGRIRRSDLWVIIPFLAFGLTSQRAVFPAYLVLAAWMVPWQEGKIPDNDRTTSPSLLLIAAATIAAFPFILVSAPGQLDNGRFPVEAARYLSDGLLFHDDFVGGYLIYESWPDITVFVDDRAELYGSEFFDLVIRTRSGGPEWAELQEIFDIDQVIVRNDDQLSGVLEAAGWTKTYADEKYVVLTR
jgi:hypothetical protein